MIEAATIAPTIAETLIRLFDTALARVWLLGPGDLCSSCPLAGECPDRRECLHLVASAGLSARLDGPFRRFPVGARQVGEVARTLRPFVANENLADLGLAEATWLVAHRLKSFAALPLIVGGRAVGVVAMFSRATLADEEVHALGLVCRLAPSALPAGAAPVARRGPHVAIRPAPVTPTTIAQRCCARSPRPSARSSMRARAHRRARERPRAPRASSA
jgi:GAF domain-containing protein